MLAHEARWFGRQLTALPPAELYPQCNLGSATASFRQETQPWIDRHLFRDARAAGHRVVHVDLAEGPGVDLSGDLDDAAFLARLAGEGFRSAICANLLEHVPDPARMAQAIAGLIAPGGYLLVSVPHRFPYHPDPIDTMFRPAPAELAALFPGTTPVAAEVVSCGTMAGYVLGRAMRPAALWRSLTGGSQPVAADHPAAKSAERPSPWRYVPWLVRRFQVSCVVLRKDAALPEK